MKRIPLRSKLGTVRAYAIVDDDDYQRFAHHRWSLNQYGYARRTCRLADRKQTSVLLSRAIMGFPSEQVDHLNGDRLDNRRINLRVASHAENQHNRTVLQRNNSSGYRGVQKFRNKWQAKVKLAGRTHYLGLYESPLEAAEVASRFRQAHMPFSGADA